jgi:hypothetical protein
MGLAQELQLLVSPLVQASRKHHYHHQLLLLAHLSQRLAGLLQHLQQL